MWPLVGDGGGGGRVTVQTLGRKHAIPPVNVFSNLPCKFLEHSPNPRPEPSLHVPFTFPESSLNPPRMFPKCSPNVAHLVTGGGGVWRRKYCRERRWAFSSTIATASRWGSRGSRGVRAVGLEGGEEGGGGESSPKKTLTAEGADVTLGRKPDWSKSKSK
jgi:hypothetical protein